MDNPDPAKENYPIHAYLSYRCKIDRDIQARDILKALCITQDITLRYDESETREGDSLIEFMADLSAARCVFLFLSPEYFQSAYTLFELICINEQADLNKRFALPIRLIKDTDLYTDTKAQEYFDDNKSIRNGLANLLNVEKGTSDAVIWKRFEDAWKNIVLPNINILSVALESAEANSKLNELIKKTNNEIQTAIKDSENELIKHLINEIVWILEQKNIDLVKLRRELRLPTGANERSIAETLVKNSINDGVVNLNRVIEAQKKQLSTESKKWKTIFYDAEQLLGYLLLRTVNSTWWFHNEIHLEPSERNSISSRITVADSGYIEIIMARGALQPAQFCLDTVGRAKPGTKRSGEQGRGDDGMDATLLFDATSEPAIDETLLTTIYKDLFLNPSDVPKKNDELLEGLKQIAKAHFNKRRGKFVYYLVTHEYMKILSGRNWFADFQNRLAPYLRFICIDLASSEGEGEACSLEPQADLLSAVSLFLTLHK